MKSRPGVENKVGHSIFISPPNILITPLCQLPLHLLQFHFQYVEQLPFDAAVKNDSIVLFGGIVTSETSTDN